MRLLLWFKNKAELKKHFNNSIESSFHHNASSGSVRHQDFEQIHISCVEFLLSQTQTALEKPSNGRLILTSLTSTGIGYFNVALIGWRSRAKSRTAYNLRYSVMMKTGKKSNRHCWLGRIRYLAGNVFWVFLLLSEENWCQSGCQKHCFYFENLNSGSPEK